MDFEFSFQKIVDSVEYASDVVESWKYLEDRYEQTNGAKLINNLS